MTAPHHLRAAIKAASVALLTSALVGTGAPALAAGTHLCDGYQECSDRGMTASGYGLVNKQSFWNMYPGHNCTNYAAYRMIQAGLPNARPWSGGGNAMYWGRYMSRYTDSTPRVGAIAWWNDGSPGHVAYVEKVISSSEIIISQDSWRGDFSWARVTKAYRWPSGFIHFNDRRIDSRSAPTISGTPSVGNRLSASIGAWSPAPSSVDYTWKVGGKVLPGARKSVLNLSPSMLGKQVQVVVRVNRTGYPAANASSTRTAKVQAGSFSTVAAPDLHGTAQVNRTLWVSGGRWSPKPGAVDLQWSVDGQEIKGADGRRLALTPRYAGHRVSLTVTARRSGYDTVSRTFTTSAVNRALLTQTRRASVEGSRVRGQVLRVKPGAVTQRATTYVRWMRDGQPIADATDRAYRLTKDDVGHEVSARVTYAKSGYRPIADVVGKRFIKGTVKLRTTKTAIRRGVLLGLTGTVAGRPLSEPARVVVRNGGRILASGVMRDGRVNLRVKGLPRGHRTLWIYVQSTDVSVNKIVSRRAWFR